MNTECCDLHVLRWRCIKHRYRPIKVYHANAAIFSASHTRTISIIIFLKRQNWHGENFFIIINKKGSEKQNVHIYFKCFSNIMGIIFYFYYVSVQFSPVWIVGVLTAKGFRGNLTWDLLSSKKIKDFRWRGSLFVRPRFLMENCTMVTKLFNIIFLSVTKLQLPAIWNIQALAFDIFSMNINTVCG